MSTWDKVAERLPGLKRGNGNEWYSNSPFHAGSDSKAFKIIVWPDGEKGAFFNHAPHAGEMEKGSLYDLAEYFEIATPSNGSGGSTRRPYASLAEYAEAHYVPEQVFLDAKWEYVSAKNCYYHRPAVRWKVNNRWHYRFLDGLKDKPKFLWEKLFDENGQPITKSGDGWYGLLRAVDMSRRSGHDFIVLVNGEASVVVAQHFGVPAASWAGGEEHFRAEALAELTSAWRGTVWVALDADEAGKRGAKRVIDTLRAGEIPVKEIHLNLGLHDDVADLCGLYGNKALDVLRSWMVGGDVDGPDSPPDTPLELPPPDLNAIARDLKRLSRGDINQSDLLNQMRVMIRAADIAESDALVVPFSVVSREVESEISLASKYPRETVGLLSGIREFDAMTGGFDEGVYTIYGATNMGKSQFAITLAASFLTQGPGLIVPTETTPGVWMRRLAATKNRMNARLLQLGKATAEQVEMARSTLNLYGQLEAAFVGGLAPTPDQVMAAFRKGKELYGWEWLIIDSASRMGAPMFDIYPKTVYIFNMLQEIAKEFGIPVICTSQLSRLVADRPMANHEPRLEDGLGGGAIEQNSIGVYGAYDHNYYVQRGMAKDDFSRYPLGTVTMISLKDKIGHTNERVLLTRIEGGGFVGAEHTNKVNLTQLAQFA